MLIFSSSPTLEFVIMLLKVKLLISGRLFLVPSVVLRRYARMPLLRRICVTYTRFKSKPSTVVFCGCSLVSDEFFLDAAFFIEPFESFL